MVLDHDVHLYGVQQYGPTRYRIGDYLVRCQMICLLSTWLYFSGCDLQPRLRNLTGLSGRDDFIWRDLTGLSGPADFRRDLTGLSGHADFGRDLTGLSGRADFGHDLTGVSGRDLTGLSGFSNLLFGIYRLLFWKSERIIFIINA